jgi:hypothetical protein
VRMSAASCALVSRKQSFRQRRVGSNVAVRLKPNRAVAPALIRVSFTTPVRYETREEPVIWISLHAFL